MSEKQDGHGKHNSSEQQPERPAAPRTEQENVNLSIEEKGMVVMPEVPVPTNEVDVGNMPGANTSPSEGGSNSGGSEDGGTGGESGE